MGYFYKKSLESGDRYADSSHGWDLAESGWDLAECGWDLAERGSDLAEWLERPTANAVVASSASSDTVESEGRQMTVLNIGHKKKKPKKFPLLNKKDVQIADFVKNGGLCTVAYVLLCVLQI